jgi:selenocysteine-specific elongation factor
MIVGTAGHIDHGKSTLVRALTGVDTDRLPEEKQRGISIELGYAFLDAPDGAARIGFIDVPGHERLVHTMLAGATGIDLALLVVAADDGVMPQTREHFAVLSLLGVTRGAVVVTKVDRVDAARLAEVQAEVAALVAGTALAGAPVWPVVAPTGAGLAPLRDWLWTEAAQAARPARAEQGFRLAVDRAFTLGGVGTVVTGTVHAGEVRLGDELTLTPGDPGLRLRVRSLHAQNRGVDVARAGERCAINVVGIAKEQVARGQWLVAPEVALATDRLDATLTLWPAEPRALRTGMPVTVHIGASATPATVAVLDEAAPGAAADSLAPGATARVQVVLRSPVGAWHGDRVVLRDASASRTLAGGTVLDPRAPARYRRTALRLAELDALALPQPEGRRDALVATAAHGVDLGRLACAQGLRPAPGWTGWALGVVQRDAARQRVLALLAAFHERQPDEAGPDTARLRRLALPRLPEPLWRSLLEDWLAAGLIGRSGAFLHLPEHGVRLSATEERIAQKAAPRLAAGGFEGVWARDLARDCQEPEALMRTTLARLAQRGELHQVVKDLYYPPDTLVRLAETARQLAAGDGGQVTAARFRDATQLGRKRAIQVLEYLDRVGVLRRVGDVHRLRTDTSLFASS